MRLAAFYRSVILPRVVKLSFISLTQKAEFLFKSRVENLRNFSKSKRINIEKNRPILTIENFSDNNFT